MEYKINIECNQSRATALRNKNASIVCTQNYINQRKKEYKMRGLNLLRKLKRTEMCTKITILLYIIYINDFGK